jgi:hypothetical protein
MRGFMTRAVSFFVAAAIAAPAWPQIRNAPRPVMASPNTRPADVAPTTYTDLAFTVWTGDDDLRSGSTAWAELHFPDGKTERCNLRPEHDTWGDNSAHSSPPCVLSEPRRLSELKATRIRLDFDGMPFASSKAGEVKDSSSIFETYDNWKVNQVRVYAENPSKHQKVCLLDAKGNPLFRLKQSNRTFALRDVWNSC